MARYLLVSRKQLFLTASLFSKRQRLGPSGGKAKCDPQTTRKASELVCQRASQGHLTLILSHYLVTQGSIISIEQMGAHSPRFDARRQLLFPYKSLLILEGRWWGEATGRQGRNI